MRNGFIVGFILIIIGLGGLAYYELHVKAESGAREYLSKAKLVYERGTRESINKSIDIFADIIAKYPDTNAAVESFYYIGKCYEKLGLNRLAYLKYIYLLKNHAEIPESIRAELHTRIARLRVMRNYSEEGIHQLLSLLRYTNNRDFRSRVYTELGHAHLKMGQFEKSKRMFSIALSENGSNEDAILGKARSFKRLGQAHRAYDLYEHFLKYYGNFSQYANDVRQSYHNQLYQSGYYSYIKGQYGNAISFFKRYLRNFPGYQKSENALFWIGQSYLSVKNYDGAISYFNRTLANTYPQMDQDARIRKGYVYFLTKKFDLAAREFQIYLDYFPNGRYVQTARKWKDMSTREILYRIKNSTIPEDIYDDGKDSDSGIDNDTKIDKKTDTEKKTKDDSKKDTNDSKKDDQKDSGSSGYNEIHKRYQHDNVAEL